MPSNATSALRAFFLGTDPLQRVVCSHSLLVLVVYGVFAGVQHVEVLMGMIDPMQSWRLSAFTLLGGSAFYGFIRSGLNLRLPSRFDKALAVPQSAWALVAISWSYGITGPARGAVMLIMLLVLIYGIFSLRPGQVKALTALGIVLLGSVMAWKSFTEPLRYDPRVEVVHMLFAAIVMVTIAVLAMRIVAARNRQGATP